MPDHIEADRFLGREGKEKPIRRIEGTELALRDQGIASRHFWTPQWQKTFAKLAEKCHALGIIKPEDVTEVKGLLCKGRTPKEAKHGAN